MNNPARCDDGSTDKALLVIVERLPPLPKTVFYEDDYHEVVRSVVVDASGDEFSISNYGNSAQPLRKLVHHFLLYEIQDSAPETVLNYFYGLSRFPNDLLSKFSVMDPMNLYSEWGKVRLGIHLKYCLA